VAHKLTATVLNVIPIQETILVFPPCTNSADLQSVSWCADRARRPAWKASGRTSGTREDCTKQKYPSHPTTIRRTAQNGSLAEFALSLDRTRSDGCIQRQ